MSRKVSPPGVSGSLSNHPPSNSISYTNSPNPSFNPPSHPRRPSHSHYPPPIITAPPISSPNSTSASPRKTPGSPSPTFSTSSAASIVRPWDDRPATGSGRVQSLDVPRENVGMGMAPPVPSKNEKRLPAPPSPHRSGSRGWSALGVYDNKLVSSTLSHLPPIPPLSPSAVSSTASNLSNASHTSTSSHPTPNPTSTIPSTLSNPSTTYSSVYPPTTPHLGSGTSRPSLSLSTGQPPNGSGGAGAIYLPDGTVLSTSHDLSERERLGGGGSGRIGSVGGGSAGGLGLGLDRERDRALEVGLGRTVMETMAHSSPNSPWSLLTVHVLPVFAGSPLKTPIEDLNQLCTSHILATSQRAAPIRLVAILTNDLREFIASGMLTLKAKFDTLEESKVISRAAEVWSFFYGQVLPYVEGVFLPFSQVRDTQPSAPHSHGISSTSIASPSIPVKHYLLSGFLLHILLPLLPRLIPLITSAPLSPSLTEPHSGSFSPHTLSTVTSSSPTTFLFQPSTADLQRLLQMALILSTQARYSSFFPLRDVHESAVRDVETSESVNALGKAVRWRMLAVAGVGSGLNGNVQSEATTTGSPVRPSGVDGASGSARSAQRNSLQRGQSIRGQAGRIRKRGWRASSAFGQLDLESEIDGVGGGVNSMGMGNGVSGTGDRRPTSGRQNSDYLQAPEPRWGRPRVDEEDDDDLSNLNYHYTGPPSTVGAGEGVDAGSSMYSGTMTTTTSTATSTIMGGSTVRGESLASYAESEKTPVADFPRRMMRQASGEI